MQMNWLLRSKKHVLSCAFFLKKSFKECSFELCSTARVHWCWWCMVRHGDFFGHNIMVTFFFTFFCTFRTTEGQKFNFSFLCSLRCLSVDSPHLLCRKLTILFYILIANAKVRWMELHICGMDEKLKVCYREGKHMEVKRKTHLIFYFLGRWL